MKCVLKDTFLLLLTISLVFPVLNSRRFKFVQTSATRFMTKNRKFDHIRPFLVSLHWLVVEAVADFKVPLLTYKALHRLVPLHLSKQIKTSALVHPSSSLDSGLLVIPIINKKFPLSSIMAFQYMLKKHFQLKSLSQD